MKPSDDICTMGQDKLVKFVGVVAVLTVIGVLLCGCEPQPTSDDMEGCAKGKIVTWGDVARCRPREREER